MLLDAHNHLQDVRLAPHLDALLPALAQLRIRRAVVNGTEEADWPRVAELAARFPWIQPSFGLHPWKVGHRSPLWLDHLRSLLEDHPHAGVGEIGLDRWIRPANVREQHEVLEPQLALAAELERPLSLHCLKAWGALRELLEHSPLPKRGFLLHSYSGPAELIQPFIQLGAYFSFPAYFLHTRKHAQRTLFALMPRERLLVETDSPDMGPPAELCEHPLTDTNGHPLNHPAHISLAYRGLAETLGVDPVVLEHEISENYARLFGPG